MFRKATRHMSLLLALVLVFAFATTSVKAREEIDGYEIVYVDSVEELHALYNELPSDRSVAGTVWVIFKGISIAFVKNATVYAVTGQTIGEWAKSAVNWVKNGASDLVKLVLNSSKTAVAYGITSSGCIRTSPRAPSHCPM